MTTITTESIDMLYVSALSATARTVDDWTTELYPSGDVDGDDGKGYAEHFTYEHDNGTTYDLIAGRSSVAGVMVDGQLWNHGDEPDEDDPISADVLAELLDVEPAYYGSEGPMMNAWWPVEYCRMSAEDAAYALRDIPVCAITDAYDDSVIGVALTGGGMDLSWELAAAYMALGFLPPLALLDLPNMAGPAESWKRDVVAAYRRGLVWMAEDCARRLTRLNDLDIA